MQRLLACLVVGLALVLGGISGCTRKPSQQELTKLEEAKSAAESADKKLSELRQERLILEQELTNKQTELRNQETERDAIKAKLGK